MPGPLADGLHSPRKLPVLGSPSVLFVSVFITQCNSVLKTARWRYSVAGAWAWAGPTGNSAVTECVDPALVGESESAPPWVRLHLDKCKALGMTVHGFLTTVSSVPSPAGDDLGSVRCVSIHPGSRRAAVPGGRFYAKPPAERTLYGRADKKPGSPRTDRSAFGSIAVTEPHWHTAHSRVEDIHI